MGKQIVESSHNVTILQELRHATTWLNLKDIVKSNISQTKKKEYILYDATVGKTYLWY